MAPRDAEVEARAAFGSKEELFTTVAREVAQEETARRTEAPIGIGGAVRAVVAHYERIGEVVLRLLTQEDRFPAIRKVADDGRRIHYEWVDRAFAPFLVGVGGAQRRSRRAQLIALTDVYMWKLMRRDLGLGCRQTEGAITQMVKALISSEGGT